MNPLTLGLFEKRFDGDDCLLELARRRFLQAGMGAELHAATPEHLEWLLKFRPGGDEPVIVHLPREFDLLDERCQTRILEFATRFAGQVDGLVLHDRPAIVALRQDYVEAGWRLEKQFEKIEGCPMLYIEYAAGVEPAEFVQFFSQIVDLEWISACLDISHAGIRCSRAAYAKSQPGEDICALKGQPARLPQLIMDIDAAVEAGKAAVMDMLEGICSLHKPVHFHLHDAHPLSSFSPFGVSDHLSFLAEIPLGFEHRGRRVLAPMFGPSGLMRLIRRAVRSIGHHRLSLTLEIHPTYQRRPLGDASSLFEHWTDKTNAEQMNHWLWILACNHQLLLQAIRAASPSEPETRAAGLSSRQFAV